MRETQPSNKPITKEIAHLNKQADGHLAGVVMDQINENTPQSLDDAFETTKGFLFGKNTKINDENVLEAMIVFERGAERRRRKNNPDDTA